jgi:hypothetical protein
MTGCLYAQFEIPAGADVQKFFGTKTMIILEDNPMSEYNAMIKEAVPKIWTITPYGFCTRKDFDEIKNKSGVSVLSIEEFFFENDKTGVKYNFLCLSLGDKVNKNQTYFDLFHFPLSYFDAEEEEYMHSIPAILRIMQEFMVYVKAHPGATSADIRKNFFAGKASLKNKTLYLSADDVEKSIKNENSFKQFYPHPASFVSYEALQEHMLNPEPETVVLFKVGMGKGGKKARCYKAILGAGDGKIYYFDYHLINSGKPDALLEEDLKKLAKP